MSDRATDDFVFGINDMASTVCGGRQFGRKFSKKDYPVLGEEENQDSEPIFLSSLSKERLPKKLSTSVAAIRDLCYDPKTRKWHWPQNGADLVHPRIFLGDV